MLERMTDAECRVFAEMVLRGVERAVELDEAKGTHAAIRNALLDGVHEAVKTVDVWLEEKDVAATLQQRKRNEVAAQQRGQAT